MHGYALFGDNEYGQVQLKMAIFATDTKNTFIDMKASFNNIFELIEIGDEYIRKNIRWSANFNTGKVKREDIPEVPVTAIREIITNSLIHREMNEPYSNNIAIYKNRIEIDNPRCFY